MYSSLVARGMGRKDQKLARHEFLIIFYNLHVHLTVNEMPCLSDRTISALYEINVQLLGKCFVCAGCKVSVDESGHIKPSNLS